VEDSASPDSTPFVIDASGNTYAYGSRIGYVQNANSKTVADSVAGEGVVVWGGNSNSSLSIGYQVNSSSPPEIKFYKSRGGDTAAPSAAVSADLTGQLRFHGYDGGSWLQSGIISCTVDATPGTGSMPGRLVFSTTPTDSGTPEEAMRIDSAKRVLIGTTSAASRGSGVAVIENGVTLGSLNRGINNTYVGTCNSVTGSTGTVVFTFKTTLINRSAFVKLSVSQCPSSNTASSQYVSAEYWFHLNSANNTWTISSDAAIFEKGYTKATHFAFAHVDSTTCTITLTNPVANLLTNGVYKVEVLAPNGRIYLDTVTTT
jgi:hypothetical protein